MMGRRGGGNKYILMTIQDRLYLFFLVNQEKLSKGCMYTPPAHKWKRNKRNYKNQYMKLTYILFSYQLTMSHLFFIFLILFTIFFRGVFSFEVERSFSTLHRLMTWLRSTMGSGRLCNLARMHMRSDISFTRFLNEETQKQFVQNKPRIL